MLGEAFTQPHAGVVAFGNDAGHAVVHHQLKLQSGIARQKFADMRFDKVLGGRARGVYPQQPRRLVAALFQRADGVFDRVEGGRQSLEQALPFLRERHIAGGAVEQLEVQLFFQRLQVLRQRGAETPIWAAALVKLRCCAICANHASEGSREGSIDALRIVNHSLTL